jgi:hypothetical protein
MKQVKVNIHYHGNFHTPCYYHEGYGLIYFQVRSVINEKLMIFDHLMMRINEIY